MLALVVAAGVMLPLSGCGGSAPQDDEPASAGNAAHDAPESGRDQVAEGGTVRWAVDRPPATLNAFHADADSATDRITGATLPALFTLDAKAAPQPNPDFLKSADVTGTEPRQTVVYKINPKARWSDGKPIGVRDFVAQWKALNGKNDAYWSARNTGYDRIKQVSRGPHAHEVKVTFARPYADWKSLFTPLYPAAVMAKPDAFNDKARTALPATAGPFRITGQSATQGSGKNGSSKSDSGKSDSGKSDSGKEGAGRKTVTLQRNPHWWGERAKLDRIQLKAVPRRDRTAALTGGKLDLAELDDAGAKRLTSANAPSDGKNGAPAGGPQGPAKPGAALSDPAAVSMRDWAESHMSRAQLERAEQQEKSRHEADRQASRKARAKARERAKEDQHLRAYSLKKALGPSYTQLALNGESGPLRDERVRRAVARAVDRSALAKQALGRYGLPTEPLGSHLRMPDQEGYSDSSGALGDEDVQAAQQLLADSGWKGQGTSKAAADGKHGAQNDGTSGDRAGNDSKNGGHDSTEAGGKAGKEDTKAGGSGRTSAGTPVRMKDGRPLSLRFVLPSGPGSEQVRAAGRQISRTLSGLGIRTQVKRVPDSSYFKDHIASGKYDLALYSWPASAYPATDGRPIFAKPEPASDGSLLVEQNYTRVGTDQIDQLFDHASRELDDSNRDELIKRADARIWAAAGSVPLYQKPQLVAARNNLANAGAFGFQTPRYQDIGYRKQ